jgi:hypothetical protein
LFCIVLLHVPLPVAIFLIDFFPAILSKNGETEEKTSVLCSLLPLKVPSLLKSLDFFL